MASDPNRIQPSPLAMSQAKVPSANHLIQGPKQLGIDIDVFIRPLMEEMKMLWEKGIEMLDEYRREYFH